MESTEFLYPLGTMENVIIVHKKKQLQKQEILGTLRKRVNNEWLYNFFVLLRRIRTTMSNMCY